MKREIEMRQRMEIGNYLVLGRDGGSYWLEVQLPDASAAAIKLNNLQGKIVPQVFCEWARKIFEDYEEAAFLKGVEE